jgi:hypothetical protein
MLDMGRLTAFVRAATAAARENNEARSAWFLAPQEQPAKKICKGPGTFRRAARQFMAAGYSPCP